MSNSTTPVCDVLDCQGQAVTFDAAALEFHCEDHEEAYGGEALLLDLRETLIEDGSLDLEVLG